MTEIIIKISEDGKLLGDVLKENGFSKRLITRLKRTEQGITRNGKTIRTIDKVFYKDKIILNSNDEKTLEPNGDLDVEILYEDNDLIVFNKPPLMPVHPSIKHQGDTLGNYFAFLFPSLTFRPVNRLDRDTSGCVIIAKNQHSAHLLQNSCEKTYFAIVKQTKYSGGRICAPIAREKDSIILRCVRNDGQYSATDWTVIKNKNGVSLIKLFLETGRTHQIRVHFAWKGSPLLGDEMYGGELSQIKRQALHCGEVKFKRPSDNKTITVRAPLPNDMSAII